MLSNLKLKIRLSLAFGATGLLLTLVAAVGLYLMSGLQNNTKDLATNWLPSIRSLGVVKTEINDLRRASLRHVLEATPEGKQAQASKRTAILDTKLPAAMAAYEPLISSDEERQIYEQFKSTLAAYKALDDRMITLSSQGEAEFAAARALGAGESATAFSAVQAALEQDLDLNTKGGETSWEQAQAFYNRTQVIVTSGVCVVLLACVAMAWRLTRSITDPLSDAVRLSQAVAQGDLTNRVSPAMLNRRDELGDLMRSMNEMSHNLGRLVGDVRSGTDAIATASTQIAQGNSDLSSRTEQQAASLQETAASMHEMHATVRSNGDNATQANQLAAHAATVAAQGGDAVNDVVATMAAIQESSRRIADIITVIDGIAFQTNILALNAAVEAARAGEQGRGFAVVAGEVRTLAQRSANAAKEIKSLITDSVEKVDVGSNQVNHAGRTIQDAVQQVRRVNDLIAEINSASIEQTTGIGQVNQAVSLLDQATQQNAALVEETSAAAESLRNQAHSLSKAVSVFKVQG